jgi:hypothetical protein
MKPILDFLDSPLGALLLAYLLPAILSALVTPPPGSRGEALLRGLLAWGFDPRKFVRALRQLVRPWPPTPPAGPSRLDEPLPPVEVRQGIDDDDHRGRSI